MKNWTKGLGIGLLVIVLLGSFLYLSYYSDPDGAPFAESLDSIQLTAEMGGTRIPLRFWVDGPLCCYAIPSGCTQEMLSFESEYGVTLRRADQGSESRINLFTGEPLKTVEWDTEYLVGCYDKNGYAYEIPVKFMHGESIPSMHITTKGGNIGPVLESKETKLGGSILLLDGQGELLLHTKLDYIKSRGNASFHFHKKAFNLKFRESYDLLGLGRAQKFCLLSQELDGTHLRNKISYDMAKESGMPFSPDSEFVDLYIDGNYWGLYLLTDKIDVGEGSVQIRDLEQEMEDINTKNLESYPEIDEDYRIYSQIPRVPLDITGGYLLEVDKFYHHEKHSQFEVDEFDMVTLKRPQYVSREQMDYISGVVLDMERALQSEDYERIQEHIDLDSWVKMGILQEIMINYDFMGSSQFFYKDMDDWGETSKIYAGPIWDMDHTLEIFTPNLMMMNYQLWYSHLYHTPEIYEQIRTTYRDVFSPMNHALLDGGIDERAAQIRPSVMMNQSRWANSYTASYSELDGSPQRFDTALADMKDYLQQRTDFLDAVWIREEPTHTVRVTRSRKKPYWYLTYFNLDGQPFMMPHDPSPRPGYEFLGWYHGSPEEPGPMVVPGEPVYEDWEVYAKYNQVPIYEKEASMDPRGN